MLWEDYYDRVFDWATSTALSRMSQLEDFGPTDEIIETIIHISDSDKKGANRLLKKALAAGVRFSAEELDELYLCCDEDVLTQAIQICSANFTTEDLERLSCTCSDDVLINIARKNNIDIPEMLVPYEEPDESLSPEELAWEYDYILACLQNAHKPLVQAYKFSLADFNVKNGSMTVMTSYYLLEAQSAIDKALSSWSQLDAEYRSKVPLQGIQLNISKSMLWSNFLFNSIFANIVITRRIHKVIHKIEDAMRVLRGLLSRI